MTNLILDERAIDLLDKYCEDKRRVMIRPPTPSIMIGRVAREWYSQSAYQWSLNPNLIPALPKIPMRHMASIEMKEFEGKRYRKILDKLNRKLEIEINEGELLTWLVVAFWKQHEMHKRTKRKTKQIKHKKYINPMNISAKDLYRRHHLV